MKPVRLALDNVGSPRLRLTLAYAGILVLLLVAFSFVVFALLSMLVWQDVEPFRDDPSIVAAGQRMLESYAWRLAIANVAGLFLAAGAAFLLAKVTLRPLEQAIALQQQFTNDASHDLRTPLAVIRTETSAALGNGAPLSSEAAQRLEIIDEQAKRMERLIDQLLTLSHVDADSALNREPADLSAVVNGVVRDLKPLAEAKNIDVRVARSESAVVLGDELKLSQMVGNLVDNAIKYSPDRTAVDVAVWQNRDAAFLTVTDQGMGIPPAETERIFLRFHRADRTGVNGRSGHGLGLPLCRWIARAHGGEVSVESHEGIGSTFTVRLPAIV
ncbi:MAG TPA: HAMP domain-containing sensor histidine kinase [Candidatus Eremiobacteraceae bacterium]|nr:HAMP domain-containing sensor histidine kinase [Candidatus Eremiobacteraceae bacterium]